MSFAQIRPFTLAALAGLTVASLTFGPRLLDADDDAVAEQIGKHVAAATPMAVRANASLVPDRNSPSGWSAEIRVNNPLASPTEVDAHVRVAELRGGEMSRMPAQPVVRYETDVRIDLAANGKQTILVPVPKSALPQKKGKATGRTTVLVQLRPQGSPFIAAVEPMRRPFRMPMLQVPDELAEVPPVPTVLAEVAPSQNAAAAPTQARVPLD
jgi:hypothetical protein